MHADDHQLYALSSDMEIVNANLTRSAKVAPGWYTSNFLNPLSPNGVQHQYSPNTIHTLLRD